MMKFIPGKIVSPSHLLAVLAFIDKYKQDSGGTPPTYKEIAEEFKNFGTKKACSTNTVYKWIEKMIQLKWIERDPKISRGIRITDEGRDQLNHLGGKK